MHAMLEGPDLPHSSSSHSSHIESRVMLLAAVPYIAGVSTHVLNALHSNHAHERRYVRQLQVAAGAGAGPAHAHTTGSHAARPPSGFQA